MILENKNTLTEKDVTLKNDESEDIQETQSKRILSIDRFRGFCVFCMLIFQFLKNFDNLGILSRLADHSLENGIVILPGMTLADIIAPTFIFAIGLTFTLSFTKWQKLYGTKLAIIHYLERALSIIGVGTFLDLCNKMLANFSSDYVLNAFDITILVLSIIAIIGLILRIISSFTKNKLFKIIANQIFYITLTLMGILNIIITSIDYANIVNGNTFRYSYWVTLQGIGFAILIAFPFVKSKSWVKFLGASVITILFTIYHQTGNNKQLLDEIIHGGVVGGFGWGTMLIFDMFIADLFFKKKENALVASALFTTLGVFLVQWLGDIWMGSCSPTFILVGVGLSGLIFLIFTLFDNIYHSKFDPLAWWGKNPIIMFLVEFFVLGLYGELLYDSLIANASVFSALVQGLLAIVLLTLFAYALSKKKKSISL